MTRSIVLALRMTPEALTTGPEGYLARSRAMCLRAEELDGFLVAWGAAVFAIGWDVDQVEKAVSYAASIRLEMITSESAWAAGMAEGDLEALSPDGQGILAWGSALLWATALSEVAAPGQVLIHAELEALHAGLLGVREADVGVGSGDSPGCWQLDLEHPWRPVRAEEQEPSRETGGVSRRAVDTIAELRRARARVGGRSPLVQCQAALGLAMMLSSAGRPEEALLEALDALARAREGHDARALGACMALLAKLYAGVGLWDAASALRDAMASGS